MAKIVSNQITFLDVTDQQKLSVYLTSNLPPVQIRSKGVCNPSWTETNLVIELHAFLEDDKISDGLNIEWFVKKGNEQEESIDSSNNSTLTIKENVLSNEDSKMLTYICKVSHAQYGSATSQLTYTLIDEHEGVAGESAVTFYVYAPYGNVFSNHSGSLEAKAVAYLGSSSLNLLPNQYIWKVYQNNVWKNIDDTVGDTLTIYGQDVVNIQTYSCTINYNGKDYTAVITFEDKSDTYVSEMLTIGGNIFKNGQGGSAVYVIVRSNGKEVDSFPDGCYVGTDEPSNPASDMYWWKITDGAATFMKYDGSEWNETLDDVQKLDYVWTLMDKNGNISKNFNKSGKVIYLSCSDIKNIGTLQCDVKVKEGYVTYNNGMVSINESSGLSASDDGNGNVTVSSSIEYTITDDNNGNVIIT